MESGAAYQNLVERLIRVIKKSKKGLGNTLRAAGLGEQHLRSAKHRQSLRVVHLLRIIDVLETTPQEFFRQTFPGSSRPAPGADPQPLRGAILDELWRELDGAPPGTKKQVTKCVGKSEGFLRQIRSGETSVVSGLDQLGAILDCLAIDWRVFLRKVLEQEDPNFLAVVDRLEDDGDPVERFLASAGPPPEELAVAEGFDDPIPPQAQAELEKIERLRPEKPAEAARQARGLVRSLNLNVSLRAAALWASCLRLEVKLPAAAAVVAGGIRIARAKDHRRGEADLLYQMAFVVADDAGNKDGYLTAAKIAERAVLEYLNLGDLNKTAMAQTGKAVFLLRSGNPKTALVILRAGQALAQDLLLKAQICGNMALGAIQLRRLKLARQHAAAAAEHFEEANVPRQDVGRFLWLQARLEVDRDVAERLFLEGRDLLSHLSADSALLTLDLARSYLKWRRPADAAKAAREAAMIASVIVPKSQLVKAVVEQLMAAAEVGRVSVKLLAAARRIISSSMAARTARRLDRPR
jgi:hypothetical protein